MAMILPKTIESALYFTWQSTNVQELSSQPTTIEMYMLLTKVTMEMYMSWLGFLS